MNLFVLVIIALLGLGGAGYFVYTQNAVEITTPTTETEIGLGLTTNTTTTTTTVTVAKTVIVSYQNSAFSSKTVEINKGDTVRFVNNHTATIRIASDPHPFHTSYPALDSDTLQPGASYSITFDRAVTVNYHNHFNPGVTGTVIVR